MPTSTEWHTDRLLIRRFCEQDLEGFHELHGDSEAMHFLGGAWPSQKSRDVLAGIIANYVKTELEWMAVTRVADGAFLGVCWLGRWGPFWRPVLPPDDIELGYRYARRFWGQGYATEAARAMIRRGFDELGFDGVAAIVDVNNLASERVLQKTGMTPQRDISHQGVQARYYKIVKPSGEPAKASVR